MNSSSVLIILILASSLVPAIWILFLKESNHRFRTAINLTGAMAKLGLVVALILGVLHGKLFVWRIRLLADLHLAFEADALSLLFVSLSTLLWLVTTVYAVGYLEQAPHRSRFFSFFSLCVFSSVGLALSSNLFTFLVFYELLTLSTYPLVVHRGTRKSLRAGAIYLGYTLSGGMLLLVGVAWLRVLTGSVEFTAGGLLEPLLGEHRGELTIIFWLLIAGLGVKAAVVPLHGWLPKAMVAPAPVSALLHAVAVVKAGAFGILRVIYDVYGVTSIETLGLGLPMAILAAVTIIYASVRALFQNDLKKRLAYSTVSQVSYIILGAAILGPVAAIGGLVHLVHQGLLKITLFFCAGNFAERLHIHRISELNGVGRLMPLTCGAFTVGAFGMIGVPPTAGFVTKWFLGSGALAAGADWVVGVLVVSSLLNAMYFLPILKRIWFLDLPSSHRTGHKGDNLKLHWMLLVPPLLTAALAIGVGLFSNAPFSPLNWCRLIVAREYGLQELE